MLIRILVFFIVFSSSAYAYVDPGTGSALVSGVMGLAATAFFAVKSLIANFGRIIARLTKQKTDATHREIILFTEDKRYWVIFKPLLNELLKRGKSCVLLTQDENDPCLDYAKEKKLNAFFIGAGNKGYHYLNFIKADLCVMSTPNLDVFQMKRSKGVKRYSYYPHSFDDLTGFTPFAFDSFDSIFAIGQFQIDALKKINDVKGIAHQQFYITGYVYFDELEKKRRDLVLTNRLEGEPKTVLISPSWGEHSALHRYGIDLLKPLAEAGYNLIVRPHPQTLRDEKAMLEDLQNALSSYPKVKFDFDADNLASMQKADLMISDFSGIVYEFAFIFGKPSIVLEYDYNVNRYDALFTGQTPLGFTKLNEIGYVVPADQIGELPKIIENLHFETKKEAIENMKRTYCNDSGQAVIKTADAIEDILMKIPKD